MSDEGETKGRQKEETKRGVCEGGERRELMFRLNELTVFYRYLEKGGG